MHTYVNVNQVKFTAYQRDRACTRLWLSKGLTLTATTGEEKASAGDILECRDQ